MTKGDNADFRRDTIVEIGSLLDMVEGLEIIINFNVINTVQMPLKTTLIFVVSQVLYYKAFIVIRSANIYYFIKFLFAQNSMIY